MHFDLEKKYLIVRFDKSKNYSAPTQISIVLINTKKFKQYIINNTYFLNEQSTERDNLILILIHIITEIY